MPALTGRLSKALSCVIACLALGGSLAAAPAGEKELTVEPREKWADVFAGKEVDFHFVVKSPKQIKGLAGWSFYLMPNRATVATGEAEVTAGPDSPGSFKVHLRLPETRPGVVLEGGLAVVLTASDGRTTAFSSVKRLWIFPENPFAGREQWLKGLKLSLYDPEKTTADTFRKMNIPFDEVNNPAAFGDLKGVLVIGAGVSFRDYPDLAEGMVKAAAGGVRVLCLAPAGGSLPLPGSTTAKLPAPASLNLHRQDVIRALDRRLDAQSWPPDGKVLAAGLTLTAAENVVSAEVTKEADAWPWFEVVYPEKKGRLVICGFAILGHAWEAGPAPRFLLARLLEHVTGPTDIQPSQEKETGR